MLNHTKRTRTKLIAAIGAGIGILVATAFADVHDINVSANGDGAHWSNGTVYNVPVGAEVDWSIYTQSISTTCYGQVIFDGCGLSENVSTSAGGSLSDYAFTSSSGDISYQVSAQAYDQDSADAELIVAW